jgi:hypothetical protein
VNTTDRLHVEAFLDRVLYTPLGVLVGGGTAELNPTEVGRRKVSEQLVAAKVIGAMAVSFAVKEFTRRYRDQRVGWRVTDDAAATAPSVVVVPEAPARHPAAPARARPARTAPVKSPSVKVAFPILGYDDLTAAEIVPRLAGLTRAQLRRVASHERAGRGRRTILGRIDQLLDRVP